MNLLLAALVCVLLVSPWLGNLKQRLLKGLMDVAVITLVTYGVVYLWIFVFPIVQVDMLETVNQVKSLLLPLYRDLLNVNPKFQRLFLVVATSIVTCLSVKLLWRRIMACQMVSRPGSQCDAGEKGKTEDLTPTLNASTTTTFSDALKTLFKKTTDHANIAASNDQIWEEMKQLRSEMNTKLRDLHIEIQYLYEQVINSRPNYSQALPRAFEDTHTNLPRNSTKGWITSDEPQVNVTRTPGEVRKPHKSQSHKSQRHHPKSPQVISTPESSGASKDLITFDISKYANFTEDELREELRKRELSRRQQNRELEFLTETEKEMGTRDLGELMRYWKKPEDLKPYDHRSLGQLTREEAELPRSLIKRLITIRKNQAYLKECEARGEEIKQCEFCSRRYPSSRAHYCFKTGWVIKETTSQGVPKTKDVVVTQDNKNTIKITQQTHIDKEKMLQDFNKMRQMLQVYGLDQSETSLERNQRARARSSETEVKVMPQLDDSPMVEISDVDESPLSKSTAGAHLSTLDDAQVLQLIELLKTKGNFPHIPNPTPPD